MDLLLESDLARLGERLWWPLPLFGLGDLDMERDGECETRLLATGEYDGEPRLLVVTGLLDLLRESPLATSSLSLIYEDSPSCDLNLVLFNFLIA